MSLLTPFLKKSKSVSCYIDGWQKKGTSKRMRFDRKLMENLKTFFIWSTIYSNSLKFALSMCYDWSSWRIKSNEQYPVLVFKVKSKYKRHLKKFLVASIKGVYVTEDPFQIEGKGQHFFFMLIRSFFMQKADKCPFFTFIDLANIQKMFKSGDWSQWHPPLTELD